LVPAALVAGRDAALVVAAARPLRRLEQALLRRRLGDLLEGRHRAEAAARARRLVLAESHLDGSPFEDLDLVALAQLHDGLLPAGLRALVVAARFGLGCTLTMFTPSTFTSKSCSTAWRIWVLCAFEWTRNEYLLSSIRL